MSEIFGPWIFGVAIFTVLIMAGTFLFQLTEFTARGVPILTVLTLIVLLLPGIMATTFPMAMLLATLLAFGRLSGESEITAMRAAGTSLVRIMVPVGLFGALVALLAFSFGNFVVPRASIQATVMRDQIARQLAGSSMRETAYMVVEKTKDGDKTVSRLTAGIQAVDFDISKQVLRGATVTAYGRDLKPQFFLMADELEYTGPDEWRIRGNARLTSADGQYTAVLRDGAWPSQVAKPAFSPEDLLVQNARDMTALSMDQLRNQVELGRVNPDVTPRQLYNWEKGFWDKIAIPLASIVYALLGAPLGIRNHRTGAGTGFFLAVVIIFAYYMLSNVLFISGQGGAFPAFVASFLPVVLGFAAAGTTIYLKNR